VKFISVFFKLYQGGVVGVEDVELRQRVLQTGNACGNAYRELLQNVHLVDDLDSGFTSSLLISACLLDSLTFCQGNTEVVCSNFYNILFFRFLDFSIFFSNEFLFKSVGTWC